MPLWLCIQSERWFPAQHCDCLCSFNYLCCCSYYLCLISQICVGNALAQWWDHSLAVLKLPGSNLVRTSPVHPAVKGCAISDSAWYCQNASLWASNKQPACILPRKLRWFQIDTWSKRYELCGKALYKCSPLSLLLFWDEFLFMVFEYF